MAKHFLMKLIPTVMLVFVSPNVVLQSLAAEKIKIGLLKTSLNGPMFIASEKGYFAAEGLDADLIFFEAAQPVAVAVVSGDLQFGAAATTAGLYSLGAQGALRIVASLGFETPGFSALAIVASNRAYDSGLTTLKALSGHSVAVTQVGSGNHYSLALIGEKYGLDLKSVRILPLQSNPNAASAVIGGQADAGVVAVNNVAPAIDHHDLRLLAYDGDEVPWELGAIFTTTKLANERRDVIEKFLRAFRKGARDYHDAFTGAGEKRIDGPTAPEILAVISKYTGQPEATLRTAIGYVDPEARVDLNDI